MLVCSTSASTHEDNLIIVRKYLSEVGDLLQHGQYLVLARIHALTVGATERRDNNFKRLEDVLQNVEKECPTRRAPITRRFIVTQGIFEEDGARVDFPKRVSGGSEIGRSHSNLALRNRSS